MSGCFDGLVSPRIWVLAAMQVEEFDATSGWCCYLQKPPLPSKVQSASKSSKSQACRKQEEISIKCREAATNVKWATRRGKKYGQEACSRFERVIATSVSTFPKGKSNTCPAFFSKVFFNKHFFSFLPTHHFLFLKIMLLWNSYIWFCHKPFFQHSIYPFFIID